VKNNPERETRKTIPVSEPLHRELAHRAIEHSRTLIEETEATLRLGLKRGSP
jgi:hypothetical protein